MPKKDAQLQKKRRSIRAPAAKQGLAPKARKAFAIFLKEKSSVAKGASREACLNDMKRVAAAWRLLPESEKAKYKACSAAEFKAQRDSLLQNGIYVREHNADKQPRPEPQPLDQDLTESFKVGPYVVKCPDSSKATLGGGTYGKVFLAFSKDGRPVALKLFRTRFGKQEASHEIEQYKALDSLEGADRQWFPAFMGGDAAAAPFPWMALAFAGTSLSNHLRAHGPLPKEVLQPFALQLQRGIHVLHTMAGLLHLDLKPANLLWHRETLQLQIVDLGMCEPTPGINAPLPRFAEYTTALYRPPELWDCVQPLPLSRAVDMWSIGCILFEASCAMPLMQPDNSQLSTKGVIRSWCVEWPSLMNGSNAKRHISKWNQKLWKCGAMRALVLSACSPDRNARTLVPKKHCF